ncbi:hypothetical protein JTE90_018908 [Oedothorax gibbosus]|uniref:Uncharacterized protein n=1 Tax=Oedothorax gibbosus TaxID=931172 RepID=A0AAV6VTY2_9ARAC|nr:hypothetical protein JTE90_018908 [Oedothorax gibbosus]
MSDVARVGDLEKDCCEIDLHDYAIERNYQDKMNEDQQLSSKPKDQAVHSLSEEVQDDYKYEYKRIETFSSWKVDCPVDAARLAKAGFYYSGNGDEVICFSCDGHIKNWNYGDIVQKRHLESFPNCNFVNNRSSNVPMNQNNKMNDSCKNAIKTAIDFNKMKSVDERLKSYALNWPLPCVSIRNLAEAGFFYLGYEDKVQCPFCKGILGNWKVGADPFKEHANNFPDCSNLCDILSNLNLKEDVSIENYSDDLYNKSAQNSDDLYNKSMQNSEDVCNESTQNVDDLCKKSTPNSEGLTNNSTNNTDSPSRSRLINKNQEHLKKLGVLLHKNPASPHHASYNSRLQSFASWPVSAPVTKENLAKAGFYYAGIKDHTKCFHCDGGLCNWEYGDDPWIEHARWFFNCGFLHLNKGSAFIEDCKNGYIDKIDVASQIPHIWSETLMLQVDKAMNSAIVKNVLETSGFPAYIIRAAVLRQIKKTNSSFSTKEDLCFAVTSLKNEMEKKPLKVDNFLEDDSKPNKVLIKEWTTDNDGKDMKLKSSYMDVSSDAMTKPSVNISDDEASFIKDQYFCIVCMEQKVHGVKQAFDSVERRWFKRRLPVEEFH